MAGGWGYRRDALLDSGSRPTQGSSSCGAKSKRLGVCFALAALFTALAVCSIFFINWQLQKGLTQQFVITGPSNPNYEQFITSNSQQNAIYKSFYLWNLTNAAQVANGAKPMYQEVGPYVYRQFKMMGDVSFTADGEHVTFVKEDYYTFEPTMSPGVNPATDIIWNVNPGYMGAVAQAQREAKLTAAVAVGQIRETLEFMQSTLIADLVSNSTSYSIKSKYMSLVAAGGRTNFLATWLSSSGTVPTGYNGMVLSQPSGVASGISQASAGQLFSSQSNSLLDGSFNAAKMWNHVFDNATAAGMLAQSFGITTSQVMMVATWRQFHAQTFSLKQQLLHSFGASDSNMAGYMQLYSATLTYGNSITTLYPNHYWNMNCAPEISITTGMALPAPVSDLVNFLNGTNGIFVNPQVMSVFQADVGAAFQTGNWSVITNTWGFDQTTATGLMQYTGTWTSTYSVSFLQNLDQNGAGLMARRTAQGWLFDAVDPLLAVVLPRMESNGHLFPNDTSVAVAEANLEETITMNTGAANITLLGNLEKVNGQSEFLHHWNGTLKVEGTLGQQFHFFITPGTNLTTWEPDLLRHLRLYPTGNQPIVKGIRLLEYNVDPASMGPDPMFYQTLQGFWNIAPIKDSTPVMVSNPHFYGADPIFRNVISGVSAPVASKHLTTINIEPITGSTMSASKRVQVNLYLESGSRWFNNTGATNGCPACHPNLPTGVMYPLVWYDESGQVNDANADQWHSKVGLALKMKVGLPVGFGIVAVLFVFVGIASVTVCWKFQCVKCRVVKRDDYDYDSVLQDSA